MVDLSHRFMTILLKRYILLILPIVLAYFATTYLSHPAQHRSITMSLSSKLSITDLKLEGERVLIRVDFNVP
jgi:hypothetical protein